MFEFPYWIGGWVHPFESRWSALQKYAWVDRASAREYTDLTAGDDGNDTRQRDLEPRLFAAVPESCRAARIRLWTPHAFPSAVCPVCLETGYWSELPQLAGYDHCPMHGLPLQSRCGQCGHPLRFGRPRFGETGPFVCGTCNAPLTAYPKNACLQWHQPPADTLVSCCAPLNAIAQQVAAESEGHWEFPARGRCIERQSILRAFTGFRLHSEQEAGGTAFGGGAADRIVKSTFVLSNDGAAPETEADEARRVFGWDAARNIPQSRRYGPSGVRSVAMKPGWLSHDLDFRTGGALFDNVGAVLETLESGVVHETSTSIEDHLCAYLLSRRADLLHAERVARILLILSASQVTRVLLWLEWFTAVLAKRIADAGALTAEVYTLLEEQPYDIDLKWGRVEEQHFVFRMDMRSWFPPYRIRHVANGIELTVFQFTPQFEVP